MAGVKINELPSASAIAGTEQIPLVQAGTAVRATPAQLSTYFGSNLPTITSLGTVTTGTWQASVINAAYGGTGFGSYTAGDILYAIGTATFAKLSVGAVNQSIGSTGTVPQWEYPKIPARSIGADITLALTDGGGGLYHPRTDTTARTITVPNTSTVAFPVGTVISIYNGAAAGALSISPAAGVNIEFPPNSGSGQRTIQASGLATLWHVESNRWVISGVGVS